MTAGPLKPICQTAVLHRGTQWVLDVESIDTVGLHGVQDVRPAVVMVRIEGVWHLACDVLQDSLCAELEAALVKQRMETAKCCA